MKASSIASAGLGLRRTFLDEAIQLPDGVVDFWEVAPENWMRVGGQLGRKFKQLTERQPFVAHGLSLSIGGPDPLDLDFVRALKGFLDEHGIVLYTEHLSYCAAKGHLYDLMPIPFTEEAVLYVSERIRIVQDILERPIGMENVSYYAAPGQEMSELAFINAVLEESGCLFHFDVNNVYVNSINHRYDPYDFIGGLNSTQIAYGHIAGHYEESESLRIDTHGADVIEPVWRLLDHAFQRFGVFPTLLERDFNIPPLDELLLEVDRISVAQMTHQEVGYAVANA